MDYGDVVYDQPSNDAFSKKPKTAQWNAALATKGAIKGAFHEKFYQELGLEIFNKKDRGGPFAYFTKLFQINYQHNLWFYSSIKIISETSINTFHSFSCRTEYHCTDCK